jgi:hypothetical protein
MMDEIAKARKTTVDLSIPRTAEERVRRQTLFRDVRNMQHSSDQLREKNARLREALEGLIELCQQANHGAFHNGVTDSTGTIDEGDYRASTYIDRARAALKAIPWSERLGEL